MKISVCLQRGNSFLLQGRTAFSLIYINAISYLFSMEQGGGARSFVKQMKDKVPAGQKNRLARPRLPLLIKGPF